MGVHGIFWAGLGLAQLVLRALKLPIQPLCGRRFSSRQADEDLGDTVGDQCLPGCCSRASPLLVRDFSLWHRH